MGVLSSRERDLRRRRVRAGHRPACAARGARRGRQPGRRDGAAPHGRRPSASSRPCRSGSRSSGSCSALSASRCSRATSTSSAALRLVPDRLRVLTYLSVVLGELVPKAWRCRRPSGRGAARDPARLAREARLSARVAPPGLRERRVAPLRRPACARGGRRPHGGGHPPHRRRGRGHGRDRGGRGGDALQGLRLRRQGGARGDGAAARGRRPLGRPSARRSALRL